MRSRVHSTTMLLGRQKLLLAMLDTQEERIEGADFQNLLFLYTREFEQIPSYDFVPCAEGRFSFTVRADAGQLLNRGLLLREGAEWVAAKRGRELARALSGLAHRTAYFNECYRDLRGAALVRKVLAYAGDESAARRMTPPGLWTIGYEGKSLERYLNQLLQAGITLLCDVRRSAFSRKYGFSKSTLRAACECMGIRYEHLPSLGIASERRRALAGVREHELLFTDYVQRDLPQQRELLTLIESWVKEEAQRVALTCFESDPLQCHRHCVGDFLARETGLIPVHL
ncbi:MAG TPA: DUF488 domain-containing protein [Gammaproteobacteria bacterium]|nr:DUF488 domain-containing protein [Gammaproteobacteria bacterium]